VGAFSSRGPGLEADLPSCVGRDCVSVYRRDDAESLAWQAGAQGAYFGGLIWAVEGFDPAGLRLGKTEATLMDPQHRLLMQAAAEVLLLESGAGRAPSARTAGLQGVYVGISSSDYGRLLGYYLSDVSPYAATGNALSVAAGRLSFAFDWRGPSLSVDTACSSSLVGTHLSCQGLRQQDCAAALVAGTNLTLTPDTCMVFKQAGMLAADGRCKTLDSSADGYGRGEACGAVSLRSAEEGADGTASATAAAVVGSGVNQDGRSSALTAPSGPAQQRVLEQALRGARLPPSAVVHLQLHGTATSLGDPIEVGAASQVLLSGASGSGAASVRGAPLVLHAGKSSVGHTEPAAGVTGLLHSVRSLTQTEVCPVMHLHAASALLHDSLVGGAQGAELQRACEVPRQRAASGRPGAEGLVGGASSFAFQGTNAHALLAQEERRAGSGSGAVRQVAGQVWRLQRCWVAPLSHPLLQAGRALGASPGGGGAPAVALEAALTRPSLGWLWDHCVAGRVVLPGAAYLEAAASVPGCVAQRRLAATLEGCALVAPLVLPAAADGAAAGGAEWLVCRADPLSGAVAVGRRVRGPGAGSSGASVATHMQCHVSPGPERGPQPEAPSTGGAGGAGAGPDAQRCRSVAPLQWAHVYRTLASAGLQYGQAFQPVCGPVMCRPLEGALGSVVTQPRVGRQEGNAPEAGTGVHPTALDGVLQLAAAAHAGSAADSSSAGGVYVPAAVDAYRLGARHRDACGGESTRLAATAGPGSVEGAPSGMSRGANKEAVSDHGLRGLRGDLVAALVGLHARQLHAPPAARPRAKAAGAAAAAAEVAPPAGEYYTRWQCGLGAQTSGGVPAGQLEWPAASCMVLSLPGYGEARAAVCAGRGSGSGAARAPARAGAWGGRALPAAVAWAQALRAAAQASPGGPGSAPADAAGVQVWGCGAVSWDVLPAAAGAGVPASPSEGVWAGLVHAALQEMMGVPGAVLDVDAHSARGRGLAGGAAAPAGGASGFMAALRASRQATVLEAQVARGAGGSTAAQSTGFGEALSATVVGGLGALGAGAAACLAERGSGHLRLLGRSGRPSGSQVGARLPVSPSAAAGFGGVSVQLLRCDAACAEEAALVASLAVAAPSAPGACLHAAGVLRDAMLPSQSAAAARQVAAPKAGAAVSLAAARCGPAEGLRAEVLFSSVAALLGSAGQANYAAANCWLDAWASRARGQGCAASSVQWGAWAGAGMASQNAATAARLQRAGMWMLSPQQGLEALGAVVGSPGPAAAPAVVAALAMDWARFGGMLPSVPPLCGELVSAAAAQAKPAAAGGAASRALAMVPPEERQQQVQQQLQGMVQELLGRDVDPEEPLMEAGLDSMSAVELHSGVQQTMGVELPATLMFDYPTIASAAGMISDEVGTSVNSEFDVPTLPQASQRSRRELYSTDAKVVIFCLAYAGGVASSIFSSWTGGLPSYVAVAPLDLPGRGQRNNEDRSCDICGIASQFSKLISECEVPYYIFAHSTGAILMHEILMDMKKHGCDGNLIGAFASACPAPSYFMRFSMALFKKSMKKDSRGGASSEESSGGAPPSQSDLLGMLQLSRQLSSVQSTSMLDMLEGSGVFSGIEKMRSNESIYSQVMPLIIDDIEMIVRYRYEPHELLETPIVCFRGSEDNTHESDTVHMWKNVTVEDTSVFVVPGDHFFLHNKVAKDLIFSIIMEYVEKATTGRHVQTHSGERVARNTFSRPSSSDNVAIMIPSGLDSNNMCSMQEIFDGLVARTFCAPSDCGMSKLRQVWAVPNVIVASAAGLETAIALSKEYASVFGEVPKVAVFDFAVGTEAAVPEHDGSLGTQDMIHFFSYTSKGPKNIRTMGNHLSVAVPCQPDEIVNLNGNCMHIVLRALADFICFRSLRQPE